MAESDTVVLSANYICAQEKIGSGLRRNCYNYFWSTRLKIKSLLLGLVLSWSAANIYAEDIAYGTIKGIKVYDFPNSKVTKIYFNSDATSQVEDCEGIAVITHSLHDEATRQSMTSVALAAYMSGKKVRAYSYTAGSCEASLVSVQDSYF